MRRFSPQYRAAIEASLRAFVNDGDDVACIGYYTFRYGNCDMCPKEGIRWHYVLENLRTHRWLIVGSECVDNYQVILAEWGYKPDRIVFPNFLRRYARWILERNPDAVVFDDGIVMRFHADCGAIIKRNTHSALPDHCSYATRFLVSGAERFVAVDEAGRQFPLGPVAQGGSDQARVDFDPQQEEGSEFCDCGVEPFCCPDCDNDVCPECGAGCICEDHDYEEGDGQDEEDHEPL